MTVARSPPADFMCAETGIVMAQMAPATRFRKDFKARGSAARLILDDHAVQAAAEWAAVRGFEGLLAPGIRGLPRARAEALEASNNVATTQPSIGYHGRAAAADRVDQERAQAPAIRQGPQALIYVRSIRDSLPRDVAQLRCSGRGTDIMDPAVDGQANLLCGHCPSPGLRPEKTSR